MRTGHRLAAVSSALWVRLRSRKRRGARGSEGRVRGMRSCLSSASESGPPSGQLWLRAGSESLCFLTACFSALFISLSCFVGCVLISLCG